MNNFRFCGSDCIILHMLWFWSQQIIHVIGLNLVQECSSTEKTLTGLTIDTLKTTYYQPIYVNHRLLQHNGQFSIVRNHTMMKEPLFLFNNHNLNLTNQNWSNLKGKHNGTSFKIQLHSYPILVYPEISPLIHVISGISQETKSTCKLYWVASICIYWTIFELFLCMQCHVDYDHYYKDNTDFTMT